MLFDAYTTVSIRPHGPLYRGAQHQAALVGWKIVARMRRATVVPQQEIADLPDMAVDELRLLGVIEQRFQQRVALLLWQAFDLAGHQPVDIDRLAAGLLMGAEHRMGRLRGGPDAALP